MSKDPLSTASQEEVSSFHEALVSFVRATVEAKEKKGGFSEKGDPLFSELKRKAFQKDPLSASSLEEMAEQYHTLFYKRGPLHLEQKLFQLFSKNRGHFPMYRGLPRVYKRKAPREGKVKEGFADLPRLLELMLEKERLKGISWGKTEGEAALFTWVMEDGFGDFWCAAEVLSFLKKKMPLLRLSWVAFLPKRCASLTGHPSLTAPLFYEGKFPSLELLSGPALEALKRADLILQIPTYHPETQEIEEKLLQKPIVSIGEYGFIESARFCPLSRNRSMGLHFLEKGILIREKPEKRSWKDIGSSLLLSWLQERSQAKRALAYLSHPVTGWIYFQGLIKSLEEAPEDLDLICPDLQWFIKRAEENLPPLFDLAGVSSLEVYLPSQTFCFPLQEKGKKVRLLCPGALSADDFQIALHQSDVCPAVRGNQSFSEAVASEKPFYYEAKDHSYAFVKDLSSLAENRLRAYPSAVQAFRMMNKAALYTLKETEDDWVDEAHFQTKEDPFALALGLARALQGKDLAAGFASLSRILAKEHSFADFLCPFIANRLKNHSMRVQ